MLYCEACRLEFGWPRCEKVVKAACDNCSYVADCYDNGIKPMVAVSVPHYPKKVKAIDFSRPDDIRARGWVVAVHNDYKVNGEPYTFWLFTKGNLCAKGEGKTDLAALNEVRKVIDVSAVTRAVEMLKELPAEQRLAVFNSFCCHCGSDDVRCQCWNDE